MLPLTEEGGGQTSLHTKSYIPSSRGVTRSVPICSLVCRWYETVMKWNFAWSDLVISANKLRPKGGLIGDTRFGLGEVQHLDVLLSGYQKSFGLVLLVESSGENTLGLFLGLPYPRVNSVPWG
ncbi:hypothetical protein EVAR_101517_1 [Eumeta japonica]|uniref:Uncharacterized protein n=1 Tax=Eumeta variegata TaxID=151549 RepID=A0A4C1TC49_EUMVA|nr:hypothetical protein EVAR_101517_1 [Eumeta japonica]